MVLSKLAHRSIMGDRAVAKTVRSNVEVRIIHGSHEFWADETIE